MINKAKLNPYLRCPFCNDKMILTNNNSYLDKICFRFRKSTPKHEIKIPIRKGSFLENIPINLITFYFLIFDCFLSNYSANKTYIKFIKFKDIIPIEYAFTKHTEILP